MASTVVLSGEYIWKYTHNAFDFSVLGNTPITFPIDWHNSKIPGYALHVEVPNFHDFSAYVVISSVAARFFPPQVAGAGATSGVALGTRYPFRIDHDEKLNATTHLQYTLANVPGFRYLNGLWGGFNWRFDSGLVAGSTPCYSPTDPNSSCGNSSFAPDGSDAMLGGNPAILLVDNNIGASTNVVNGNNVYLPLTADEEFQSGLSCGVDRATPTHLIGTPVTTAGVTYYECPATGAGQLTSSLLDIPAIDKGDNDHNPPRVAHRSLFDITVGKNNIFRTEKYKTDLDFTAINVTNKYALYNFLSTFSGTHYVTPARADSENHVQLLTHPTNKNQPTNNLANKQRAGPNGLPFSSSALSFLSPKFAPQRGCLGAPSFPHLFAKRIGIHEPTPAVFPNLNQPTHDVCPRFGVPGERSLLTGVEVSLLRPGIPRT